MVRAVARPDPLSDSQPARTATPPSRVATPRRTADLVVAGIGLVVLVICGVIASDGTVPAWEADIFHAINDLPGWLYRPLWPFQQLGTILVGPIVAIVAFALRKWRLGIAALAATV